MRKTQLLLALTAIGVAGSANATNGMNLEGYGPIAAGMGGASMAYDNGNAAVMNNPATLGLAADGSRFDIAVGMLGPDVTSKFPGMPDANSGGDSYYMPAVGWTKKNGAITYGVAMFAQGGMGTEYSGNSFMSAGSGMDTRSELGVGRLIAPFTYEVSPKLIVGGSVDLVWSMMDLKMAMNSNQFMDMAGAPGGFGGMPGCATGNCSGEVSGSMMQAFNGAVGNGFLNNGTGAGAGAGTGPLNWGYFDFSDGSDYTGKAKTTGYAGKIGFVFKASPALTIGGTYHSKTSLGNMKGNASVSFNVNADTGMASGVAPSGTYAAMTIPVSGKISVVDFEWPETIGFGLAYKATDKLMVAVDYKRINWADVMENFKMTFTANATQANPLATGFAGTVLDATMYQDWEDQDIFMLGLSYKATDAMTLRVGANLADNPIPNQYMNPLFPAIEKNHYTVGIGYALNPSSDLNFSLQYAPEVTQTNSAQGVTVDHSQTSWQFMYSKRF